MPCNRSNSLNNSIAGRISLGQLNRPSASKYSRKDSSIIQDLLNHIGSLESHIGTLKNSVKSLESRCNSKDDTIERLSHIIRYETRPLSPQVRNNYSSNNVISYSSSSKSDGEISNNDSGYRSSSPESIDHYSDSDESHSTIQDSPRAVISTVPSPPRVVIESIPPPPPYSSNTPFSSFQMSTSLHVNGVSSSHFNVTNGILVVYPLSHVSNSLSNSLAIRDNYYSSSESESDHAPPSNFYADSSFPW
jgi:hypothetical protein